MGLWGLVNLLILSLRGAGVLHSLTLCLFLSVLAAVGTYTYAVWRRMVAPTSLVRFRQLIILVLLVVVPSLMDPSTAEVDNLPRLTVIVTAATLIAGCWAVDALVGWRPRRLVNGLQWPIAGVVAWMGLTTATSLLPKTSLMGAYQSSDGFILILSLAVVAVAAAESFSRDQLRQVIRVMIVSSVPMVVYGVIQLHDVFSATKWDFVPWKTGVIANVFSTLGNPNHLGGVLATLLPLIVVDAVVLSRHRLERAVLAAVAVICLVLLVKTAARGAWLATLLAAPVLVVGLSPLVRRRAKPVVALVGVVVAGVIAAVASPRFTGEPLSAVFAHAAGTSVNQRYGYWMAAIRAGLHHPILGIGPDAYGSVYSRYQDAALFKTLGTTSYVNGPHNLFLAWFAGQGVLGLGLLCALVVSAAWILWRVRRVSGPNHQELEACGYTAVGLAGALVAYLVQASFDVDQVATWFYFWTILGLAGVLARSTWDHGRLVRSPFALHEVAPATAADLDDRALRERAEQWAGQLLRRGRDQGRVVGPVPLMAATLAVIGVGALVFWRADAPWRADHRLWAAGRDQANAAGADLRAATQLDPWEPNYWMELGTAAVGASRRSPASSRPLIQLAVSSFARAAELDPYSESAQLSYADALLTAAASGGPGSGAAGARALAALAQAHADSPLDPRVGQLERSAERLAGS